MPDYRNPFIFGSPVPPERFIGRKREVETILDRLANPAHASTVIRGEAGIGKTSLLHYIYRSLEFGQTEQSEPHLVR